MKNALVELLEWDTQFFGFKIAQVKERRISEKDWERIEAFCNEHDTQLLQFKCDAHHVESIKCAEKNGFHFVDIRATYEKYLQSNNEFRLTTSDKAKTRLAVEKDIKDLRKMTKGLFRQSRYYFDQMFNFEKVDLFYQDWVEKAVCG
ncbi:hypothetical protein ACFL3D_07105, partial [Candidatus Omnitrophota bacterium]